ncbi:MAG: archaetidylserine decarboxylase [Gammaproteobacteria bacterium]|nr:archaetidylserine decarboxylase [Gammaproteobacteria bacterium]
MSPGATLSDYLRAAGQYVLPKRLLSALMLRATRIRLAAWKNWQIRWFVRRYGVDLDEAREPSPRAYTHFNAFFTRALRDGARSVAGDERTLVCPADGIMSQRGRVRDGSMLQAKGRHYTVRELLGPELAADSPFRDGHFATVYLSPRHYHRVHMPLAGRLRAMSYLPGALFSVNPATTRVVPRLFARNERVASLFDTALGPMALVLVGAVMVAGIETVWAGQVTPPRGRSPRTWHYDDESSRLARGAEMGRFNMGSTVVVLVPDVGLAWADDVEPGREVRLGQALAALAPR